MRSSSRISAVDRRLLYIATTFAAAVVFMLSAALPAWAAESMTLTFIRHGESEANAAGVIDTSVPGPHLTALGRQQAQAVAERLAMNNYAGVYASSMVRTQETAVPLADLLGQTTVVLPGLREVDAGVFEGQSEDSGLGRIGYVLGPVAWTLGARFVPVVGSTGGNAFDARVDDAVQAIYDGGDRNAAVFSHGATIMFWTMMNVDNPDLSLLLSHQLDNTDVVVITGNPEDGWTLENWDGIAVSAQPSLLTKLFVDVRDVVTAPQTALYRVGQALASGDVAALARAVRSGIVDVAVKVVGFVPKVVSDIVGSLRTPVPTPSVQESPAETNAVRSVHRDAPETTDSPKPALKSVKNDNASTATDLRSGNRFEPGDTVASKRDSDDSDDSDTGRDADAPAETGDETSLADTDAVVSDDATSAPRDDGDESADAEGTERSAA